MFLCTVFEEIPNQNTLHGAISTAYERTLKPFHNFVVKGIVSVSPIRVSPTGRFVNFFRVSSMHTLDDTLSLEISYTCITYRNYHHNALHKFLWLIKLHHLSFFLDVMCV